MKRLFLFGLLVSCSWLRAHASQPNDLEHQLHLDVMEATLRSRLDARHAPKGGIVYVYVDRGLGSGLEDRLKDYRIVVRSGSVGPNPAKQRWYWMHVGRITQHHATVLIEDAKTRLRDVHLIKKGPRWVVVSEEVPILH